MMAAISARVRSPWGFKRPLSVPRSRPSSTAAVMASAYHARLSKSGKSAALRSAAWAVTASPRARERASKRHKTR